jgi:hypothetical protein
LLLHPWTVGRQVGAPASCQRAVRARSDVAGCQHSVDNVRPSS